jgi:hypothetical protein
MAYNNAARKSDNIFRWKCSKLFFQAGEITFVIPYRFGYGKVCG